ncbi:hypothetical protein [Streptomyces sp. NWU49]|uniref:hypothetical protein n=1 Tax=Streptomyces sp. NWU49 TaxID=2201153 RepID=UPI0011B757C6|nr:hypothetical protein [Streptomyces sp. NWU49]
MPQQQASGHFSARPRPDPQARGLAVIWNPKARSWSATFSASPWLPLPLSEPLTEMSWRLAGP